MTGQAPIRVFSVDDHALLRQGIATIIGLQPDMALVAQASTGSGSDSADFDRSGQTSRSLTFALPDLGGIDVLTAIRN